MVYPWHRTGSLNNDTNRDSSTGTRSAVLSKKKISNLKFSKDNTWLLDDEVFTFEETELKRINVFSSDEVSLIKLEKRGNYTYNPNYYGNVDTLITPTSYYDIMVRNGTLSSSSTS
jgi:hypothetical protein